MMRWLKLARESVQLFSILIIGVVAAPVHATIYNFTATYVAGMVDDPVNLVWGYGSDFTLQYTDADGDARFSLDELNVGTFSGVDWTYAKGDNVGVPMLCALIYSVPVYHDTLSPFTDGTLGTYWPSGEVEDLRWELGSTTIRPLAEWWQ